VTGAAIPPRTAKTRPFTKAKKAVSGPLEATIMSSKDALFKPLPRDLLFPIERAAATSLALT
jgi:hypothetical protein